MKSKGWRRAITGNVLALGLVSCFTDMSSEMIYPLLPIFIGGLVGAAAAPVYIGLMDGIAESVSSLLKIYAGRVSDLTLRRKRYILAGYGISSFCRPLMCLVFAGWHVILLRFFDRVGKGLRTAPRDALIGGSVPEDVRGRAFSFHRAMDHVGAILGPVLGIGILSSLLGYGVWRGYAEVAAPEEMRALRILFGIALIPGVLAMLTIVAGVKEPAGQIAPPKASGRPSDGRKPLSGRLVAFLAAVGLFALGNSSDLFLVFYAKQAFHMGLARVVGLWILLHAAKVVFSFPGGALSDRLGRKVTIVAGWLIYVAVYLSIPRVSSELHFWVLMTLYGAYYGLTEGAEKALLTDMAPPEQRGRAFGLYHGVVGLAALPASLLFGVFWVVLGPTVTFGIGASLAGAATILLLLLRPAGRR